MGKSKKYRLLILVLFVTILFGFSIKKSTTISAEKETLPSSSENLRNESTDNSVATDQNNVESSGIKDDAQVELKNEEDVTNPFSFYMANSDQTRDFGATAIPQVISVGDTFNKEPEELVKNIVLPEGHTASFSYVDGKIPYIDNTTKNGLILKVYMVDNNEPENKLLIKVPLAIVPKDYKEPAVAVQEFTQIRIDYADYSSKVSTVDDQFKYLIKKAGFVAWNVKTGAPVEMNRLELPQTSLPSNNPPMGERFEATMFAAPNLVIPMAILKLSYSFWNKENSLEQKLLKELLSGFDEIPYGSSLGLLINPLNKSEMGMPFRGGLNGVNNMGNQNGYSLNTTETPVYNYSGVNHYFSNVNNKHFEPISGNYTIQSGLILTYYLKKNDHLRQVMVNEQANLIYVLDAKLLPSGFFEETMSIYNTDSSNQTIGAYSFAAARYAGYGGYTFFLRNNGGFYQKDGSMLNARRFVTQLRDSRGKFIGDQDRYVIGSVEPGSEKPSNIPVPIVDRNNYFGDDFSKPGQENSNYPTDEPIMTGSGFYQQRFQMGASSRKIAPGEKLTTRIHFYAGELPPYMLLATTPKAYNVYEDYDQDSKFEYTLSNIPEAYDKGTITYTFPDDTTESVDYTADDKKTSRGVFKVPRATLPKVLNNTPGTIKSYLTDVFALNERMGVPSEEFTVPINVYNLGAKPIPQLIQKGRAFNKKAAELIREPIILPGNTAVYDYEGELPDTSTVGLKSVLVRMTDKERPDKTTLIKVPVQVVEGTPPTSGLYLAANDYTSTVQELKGITEAQVAKLILKNSEAIAWDIGTGSTEGVEVSVASTTLKPNAPIGSYKASIEAVKGTETKTKDITINIVDKRIVTVEFLDAAGEQMHEPISLLRTIGTTIDLTKEEDVQTAINKIQKERYQIYQRPENETALVVPNQDTTVAYRFEGTLFLSSYPTYMYFGSKLVQENTPFIRVEKARFNRPLTIWDNRKGNKPWVLTATLEKVLTSHEDDRIKLPDAIRYKKDKSTTVVLKEGVAESIATKKNQETGDINLSEGWETGESGLQLEVPARQVLEKGKYVATILWQVADTP